MFKVGWALARHLQLQPELGLGRIRTCVSKVRSGLDTSGLPDLAHGHMRLVSAKPIIALL